MLATESSTEEEIKNVWLERMSNATGLPVSMSDIQNTLATSPNGSFVHGGWLLKQGGGKGGRRNFTRRWFVLTESDLSYFLNATLEEKKGEIVLSSIIDILPFSTVRRECSIEIVTNDRVWVVSCESLESKTEWLQHLSRVAGIKPQEEKHSGAVYKGWLWRNSVTGNSWNRCFVVLTKQKGQRRLSAVDYQLLPKPPLTHQPSTTAQDTSYREDTSSGAKELFDLLIYENESCEAASAVFTLKGLCVINEYGRAPQDTSYQEYQFHIKSAAETWNFAADSQSTRMRWLAEFTRTGMLIQDKRPSQAKWDKEGLLRTKKSFAVVGGWKERFVRVRQSTLKVFREQFDCTIKATINLSECHVEVITSSTSAPAFRLHAPNAEEEFVDWACLSDKERDDWVIALQNGGAMIASSDKILQEREQLRCLEKRLEDLKIASPEEKWEGEVQVRKTAKSRLADQFKKRWVALSGHCFTWAHESTADIDGLICIDLRWQVHLYASEPRQEKRWFLALRLTTKSETGASFVMAFATQMEREDCASSLGRVIDHARNTAEAEIQERRLNSSNSLDIVLKDLEQEVQTNQSSILRHDEVYNDININEERVPIEKRRKRKKRTFRGGKKLLEILSSSRKITNEQTESSRHSRTFLQATPPPPPPAAPPQIKSTTQVPAPFLKSDMVDIKKSPPNEVSSTDDKAAESKDFETESTDFLIERPHLTFKEKNFQTGAGFEVNGKWKFDWQELPEAPWSIIDFQSHIRLVHVMLPPTPVKLRTKEGSAQIFVPCG